MFILLLHALNKIAQVVAGAAEEDDTVVVDPPTTSYRVYVAGESDTIATYDRAFLEDTHSLIRYDNYSYGGSIWNTDIYTDDDGQGKYWELGMPLRSNGGIQPGVFYYWVYVVAANALQPTASTSYVDQGPSGYNHAHNYALFLHFKLHSVPSDIATDTNHILHQYMDTGSRFAYQVDWVSTTQIVIKGKTTSSSTFTNYSNNITISPAEYNKMCIVVNKNSGEERIAFFMNGVKKFDSSDSSAGVGHASTLGTAVTDMLTGFRTNSNIQTHMFVLRDISGTVYNTPAKMKDLRLFNQVLTDEEAVSLTSSIDPVSITFTQNGTSFTVDVQAVDGYNTNLADYTVSVYTRRMGQTATGFGYSWIFETLDTEWTTDLFNPQHHLLTLGANGFQPDLSGNYPVAVDAITGHSSATKNFTVESAINGLSADSATLPVSFTTSTATGYFYGRYNQQFIYVIVNHTATGRESVYFRRASTQNPQGVNNGGYSSMSQQTQTHTNVIHFINENEKSIIMTSSYSTDADKKAACTFNVADLDTHLHGDFTVEFSVRNFGGSSLPFGFGLSPISPRNAVNTEAYFYIAGWGTSSASCVGDFNSTTVTIASFDMTEYDTTQWLAIKIGYDESNSGHFQLYLNGNAVGSGISSTWSAHSGLTNFAVGYRPLVTYDAWVADLLLKGFAFTPVVPASVVWADESSAGFPNWAPHGSNNVNLNSIPLFTTTTTTTSSTEITIDSASPFMPLSCGYYTRPFFPTTTDYYITFTVTMGTSGEWQLYFHHTDNTLTDNGSTGRPSGGAAYTWSHAANWASAKYLLNIYNPDSTSLEVKRYRDGVDSSIDPAIHSVTHSGTISVIIQSISGTVSMSANGQSTSIDVSALSHSTTPPEYYLSIYSKVTDLSISNITITDPPAATYAAAEQAAIPTETIDVYRTIDSANGRVRVYEVELHSGGTKVTNITSTTVYLYSDGTNPNTGATQADSGNQTLIVDGHKSDQEAIQDGGFTTNATKRLNYFRGGANPKHLYRFVVPTGENVTGIKSYYQGDNYVPGIKILRNGVMVYQNEVVPISGHLQTYTSASYSDTTTKYVSNFGTVIPNSFFNPTTTYTTATGDQVITGNASYRQSSVFRMTGSITSSTTNTLFEFGGNGRGMACYMYGGTLYVQCGDGSASGGQLELSYAVGASETITDIALSLSSSQVNSGTCNLFVNLTKVATGTYPGTSDVFGTNEGGIMQKHSSMCTTRMGAGSSSSYTLANGTVTLLEVWGSDFLNNT